MLVRIQPEPSDAEREAILAALADADDDQAGDWAEAALTDGVEDERPSRNRPACRPFRNHDVLSLRRTSGPFGRGAVLSDLRDLDQGRGRAGADAALRLPRCVGRVPRLVRGSPARRAAGLVRGRLDGRAAQHARRQARVVEAGHPRQHERDEQRPPGDVVVARARRGEAAERRRRPPATTSSACRGRAPRSRRRARSRPAAGR